jgi:hypothetical protein
VQFKSTEIESVYSPGSKNNDENDRYEVIKFQESKISFRLILYRRKDNSRETSFERCNRNNSSCLIVLLTESDSTYVIWTDSKYCFHILISYSSLHLNLFLRGECPLLLLLV